MKDISSPEKEEILLAVRTISESERSQRGECIAMSDVIELLGYSLPDKSKGESWGSMTQVTRPISDTLREIGYIKAHLYIDNVSVSRWLKGGAAKDYLAKKGEVYMREQNSKSKDLKPRGKRRFGTLTSANKKEAALMLREMKSKGLSNKEISEICNVGAATVSRCVNPNPNYDYSAMHLSIFENIRSGYLSWEKSQDKVNIPSSRSSRTTPRARPEIRDHAPSRMPAKNSDIPNSRTQSPDLSIVELPSVILDTEVGFDLIKSMVSAGKNVLIKSPFKR